MARPMWYVRRLRTMSVPEVGWRAASLVRNRLSGNAGDRWRSPVDTWSTRHWEVAFAAFRGDNRPVLLAAPAARLLAKTHPGAVADVLAAADAVLAGRVQFFGLPAVDLPAPIDWNHDPLHDVRWPTASSDTIDHRTHPGDPKWIWELNRLQHLPWLAQAWLFTDDDRYAQGCVDHLVSWLTQNPPGTGIAWRGAFEAGVRAVSVCTAVAALRNSPLLTPETYRSVVRALDVSARRCLAERSRFSSANNHLVGELAGAACVAIAFPELPDAARREAEAVEALVTEADRQILPDGVGAEQAIGYQIFTAELFAVVCVLLLRRDGAAPDSLLAAIARGADFLRTVAVPPLRIGDDDEGFALRLGAERVRTIAGHLQLADVLSPAPTPREAGGVVDSRIDLTAAWYAAATGERPPAATVSTAVVDDSAPGSTYFPDGGLVVLRSGTRRVTMDVGPLGYLAIAAHGHADALALTLSDAGADVIVDPGTGSYYGRPGWRQVMRGTSAHATVTVDDTDQSDLGGAFLWTRHARTVTRAVDLGRGVVDAEHHGYDRGRTPVVHRRWVLCPPDPPDDTSDVDAPRWPGVLIIDELTGSGVHDVQTCWPLAPDIDIVGTSAADPRPLDPLDPRSPDHRADGCSASEPADSHATTYTLSRGDRTVALVTTAATAAIRPSAVRGDELTHRGWWSDRLERREPAWWIGARAPDAQLSTSLGTFITAMPRFELSYVLSIRRNDHLIVAELSCEGVRHRCVVDTRYDGHVRTMTESVR